MNRRLEKTIIVANKKGLHARPAALFVQLVDKLNVVVTIDANGEKINGKSIMGLLTLGAQCGTSLKLIVEGDDCVNAMQELEAFLNKQEEEYLS
jgi:phosphocarrier protein HPr